MKRHLWESSAMPGINLIPICWPKEIRIENWLSGRVRPVPRALR